MNKTIKTTLALMAGAMAFTACSNDDIAENVNEQKTTQFKHMIFTATQEGQGGASRAAIDNLDIKWVDGDKIAIFDGVKDDDGNMAREFVLTDGFGTTSGTFEGKAAEGADIYYALYPYAVSTYEEEDITVDNNYLGKIGINWQELNTIWEDFHSKNREKSIDDFIESVPAFQKMSAENKAIIKAYLSDEPYKKITKSGVQRNASNQFENIVLPAEQTATAGSADPKAMLMIGESDDAYSLQFKNVCAYVKVTPQFACTSISLESKGTESLAGTVTLDYNNGTPTANITANGTNKVTLSGNMAANTAYYIAVLPATLNSGFTLTFKTSGSDYKKNTDKTLALTRNNVIDLGSIVATPENALPSGFSVSDTKKVYFSKGNLYYNGGEFKLEDNQYSIATSWNTSHVSNFFWSKNATDACAESCSNEKANKGDVIFTNETETTPNPSFTVNGQIGVWRTLSHSEWNYLFSHYKYKYTKVCGKSGLVIAPTDVTTIADSYDAAAWATAEANGYVFLPNTGYRDYIWIEETDKSCIYWSSTLCTEEGDNKNKPYRQFFQWNGMSLSEAFEDASLCYWGVGIRLVQDVR
ncbi:MAG: hypothetical protein KBS99_04865 [Prevotellaceae bacterium]|nr:hypothetical protein [Candidatus Colivivens caballi]